MNSILSHSQKAFDVMTEHLAGAARDVFADFNLEIEPCVAELARKGVKAAEQEDTGMAVIGYAGAGVRGALVMVVPETAIRSWMVVAGVPHGDPADTLGEFSNMVFGRLKERLLPFGIALVATTPTAATGGDLQLSDPPGPSAWAAFNGPGWSLLVRLDATFDEGFRPLSVPPTSQAEWS